MRTLVDTLETWYKRGLARLLSLVLARPIDHSKAGPIRSILVVRQHDQLGDMICVVPLLRTLKQAFPASRLTLVASPVNYQIMKANPWADRVLNYDKAALRSSITSLWTFLKELAAERYDLAIVPATVSVSMTSDLIAVLSGATRRIGAGELQGMKNPDAAMYTTATKLDWSTTPHRHQTLRNYDVIAPLNLPEPSNLQCDLGLTDDEQETAAKEVASLRDRFPLLIGLHPGAGKAGNRWPVERFAALADWLAWEYDAGVIVTVGPMDRETAARFRLLVKNKCTFIENRPIRSVAAIIDQLDLVISNDTGIMHIAGGLRPKLISLFGPTDPEQWAPRGKKNRSIAAGDGDITSVTTERVQDSIRSILAEFGQKSGRVS